MMFFKTREKNGLNHYKFNALRYKLACRKTKSNIKTVFKEQIRDTWVPERFQISEEHRKLMIMAKRPHKETREDAGKVE